MDQTVEKFFAWAPWVIFALIIVVTYVATRGSSSQTVSTQTFACAQCGKRGTHQQMVSVEREGAIAWYCAHCAALQQKEASATPS